MGLSIHYDITAPDDWSPGTIKAKLEEVRQFALDLPVESVSELAQFEGDEADFQHVRDSGNEDEDPFFWAKIQAQRSLCNPWQPGTTTHQPPAHMLAFSVMPAEGSEEMNIGACRYRRHVWKVQPDEENAPAWSLVFDTHCSYPESEKVMTAFLRKWKLRKLPDSNKSMSERFGIADKLVFYHPLAQASIRQGRYISHRRGHAGGFGLLVVQDRMVGCLFFRFTGKVEKAEEVFSSAEFQSDLKRLMEGEDHVTPAASGTWSCSCKTQYSNDPRCGGWKNFVKAHLAVLGILEHVQELGFEVSVRDEGGFWESHDLKKLAENLSDYDTLIAGLSGTMKDAAEEQGLTVESAMSGRPDFERLEMEAQGKIGDMLKEFKKLKLL